MPDSMLPQFGKILAITGVIFVVVGVVLIFADRIPFLGRLPGDISFKRGNWSFYFPVVTSIVLSILLTIILNLINRGR